MSQKFEELKAKILFTKKQVIDALSKLPDDVKIFSQSADSGGYDVTIRNHVVIQYDKATNSVLFDTIEYDAQKADNPQTVSEDRITWYEVEELQKDENVYNVERKY